MNRFSGECEHGIRTIDADDGNFRKSFHESDRDIGRAAAKIDDASSGEIGKPFSKIAWDLSMRFRPVRGSICGGLLSVVINSGSGVRCMETLYHLIDRDVFKFALPDNPSATANRSPYPWIRRTEQRNRWTAEIGGQVRDAGVVADIGTAAAEMVEDFRKAQILKHKHASPSGRGRAKPRSAIPKGRSLKKR